MPFVSLVFESVVVVLQVLTAVYRRIALSRPLILEGQVALVVLVYLDGF